MERKIDKKHKCKIIQAKVRRDLLKLFGVGIYTG